MERDIQTEIMLALGGRPDVRLFRNVTAMAWGGRLLKRNPEGYPPGSVVVANAHPIHAGLMVGSGDLIGWKTTLTQPGNPMIPDEAPLARFLSFEVKTATGRASPEQLIWRANVLKAGGIAGVVRSVEDAEALVR